MTGLPLDDPDFQYLVVDRKKLLKEQTQVFDGKKACWIPDPKDGFLQAEIESSDGGKVTVKILKNSEVGFLFTKSDFLFLSFVCLDVFMKFSFLNNSISQNNLLLICLRWN